MGRQRLRSESMKGGPLHVQGSKMTRSCNLGCTVRWHKAANVHMYATFLNTVVKHSSVRTISSQLHEAGKVSQYTLAACYTQSQAGRHIRAYMA